MSKNNPQNERIKRDYLRFPKQARRDLDAPVERGRRASRVHVKDVAAGLAELARGIGAALA